MRPPSHREQIPEQRCGNCRLAHLVRREHLLCFHGDNITTRKWDYGTDVILDGQDVESAGGGRVRQRLGRPGGGADRRVRPVGGLRSVSQPSGLTSLLAEGEATAWAGGNSTSRTRSRRGTDSLKLDAFVASTQFRPDANLAGDEAWQLKRVNLANL